MKLITLHFNAKLFSWLTFAFVLCTIIGTVSHEYGHGVVASWQKHDWKLHYDYMNPGKPIRLDDLKKEYKKNKHKIESKNASPEKEEYIKFRKGLVKKYKKESFFITLGGPLQTMLTGLLGFTVLWFRRKDIYSRGHLKLAEWTAVLLSYFWSRQVFNFLFSIDQTFSDRKRFASDEPMISQYLNLPPWAFGMVTCAIGAIILLWVTFKLIPVHQRLTFLASGLIGSTIGWILWMDWLGPILLP